MLQSLWIRLILLFICLVSAADLAKNQYCFDSCYEATGYIVFAGDDPELYYQSTCRYPPKVLSIYASATVYCSQDEITAGITKLQEYCTEYGPDLDLLPISDFAANLTKDALRKIPVVGYDEATGATDPYNHSIIISKSFYRSMRKTVDVWEFELWTHTTYGFAMYGFWGALLLLGILKRAFDVFVARRFEQYQADSESLSRAPTPLASKVAVVSRLFNRNLVLPFTIGTHHQRKLWGCTVPTRMVSIVVASFWILNLVLCASSYDAYTGNLYWPEVSQQVIRYLADRTGIIAFTNLPLMWVFAGRNNIFIWATGWKFSTFSIFHRNIARIATLEAIVHSAAYTANYLADGKAFYYAEYKEVWFTMGVVATVLMSFILLFSVSYVRGAAYELFLILHIAMSIVIIVALFYHVSIFNGEYDPYLWTVVAIWCFDRLLRFVRLIYCNLWIRINDKSIQSTQATAKYDEVSGIVTVNVTPGSTAITPRAGQHYYVYMPLRWRGWESHPFTLGTWTPNLISHESNSDGCPKTTVGIAVDGLKTEICSVSQDTVTSSLSLAAQPSMTFWIRAFDGFTKRLAKSCKNSPHGLTPVKILLEGPYGHHEPLHHYESVLLIAGGTGISGTYPYLLEHLERLRSKRPTRTRVLKMLVAARQAAFFHDLAGELLHPDILEESGIQVELFATRDSKKHVVEVLEPVSPASQSSDDVISKDLMVVDNARVRSQVREAVHQVQIGRPDVKACVLDFARKHQDAETTEKTAVLACGPGGMADEARTAVLAAGREGMKVDYFEDAFGW